MPVCYESTNQAEEILSLCVCVCVHCNINNEWKHNKTLLGSKEMKGGEREVVYIIVVLVIVVVVIVL